MARRKREPMSEGKKNIIGMLLEEYNHNSPYSLSCIIIGTAAFLCCFYLPYFKSKKTTYMTYFFSMSIDYGQLKYYNAPLYEGTFILTRV